MKHSYLYLLAAISLASCQKATFLEVSQPTIEVGPTAKQGNIDCHSDATGYAVDKCPDWCQASFNDSTLVYSVFENTTGALRQDTLWISCSGISKALPIAQGTQTSFIKASQDVIDIAKEGGIVVVDIETDGSGFEVKAPEGVTATYSLGQLTVEAKASEGPSLRDTVVVYDENQALKVAVNVAGFFCGLCKATGQIDCPKCNGNGVVEKRDGYHNCSACGGYDVGPNETDMMLRLAGSGKVVCPWCDGTGK